MAGEFFFFNYMNVFFEMGLGIFVFSLYKFATHYFGHIHTDTCIHLHIHAHTHAHTCNRYLVYICLQPIVMDTYLHTHTHACSNIYTHAHAHTHTHSHTLSLSHTHTHTFSLSLSLSDCTGITLTQLHPLVKY